MNVLMWIGTWVYKVFLFWGALQVLLLVPALIAGSVAYAIWGDAGAMTVMVATVIGLACAVADEERYLRRRGG